VIKLENIQAANYAETTVEWEQWAVVKIKGLNFKIKFSGHFENSVKFMTFKNVSNS